MRGRDAGVRCNYRITTHLVRESLLRGGEGAVGRQVRHVEHGAELRAVKHAECRGVDRRQAHGAVSPAAVEAGRE